MSRLFIDASLFLGMHHQDEGIRAACKAFFVTHLDQKVVMSLEQVGYCDDVVWRYDRTTQDLYYPFMDNLHTIMSIERRPYEAEDLRVALESDHLASLPVAQKLLLAMVVRNDGSLYTTDPRLADRQDLPIAAPAAVNPAAVNPVAVNPVRFPAALEQLYERSLALRLPCLEEVSPVVSRNSGTASHSVTA